MKLNIPIIAVVDTNNSFDNIDYFFPGNDDSMRAINLYCTEISKAIKKGQEFLKTQQPIITEEEISSTSAKNLSDEKVVVKKKKAVTKKVAIKKLKLKDPYTIDHENKISERLGLTININHKGKKGGSIKIDYKTLDQLEMITQKLKN